MNLHVKPKVGMAEFRSEFRKEILAISRMKPKLGRPSERDKLMSRFTVVKEGFFGDRATDKRKATAPYRVTQITPPIAAEVATFMVENKLAAGHEFDDESAEKLLDPKSRAKWAASQIQSMSKVNDRVLSEDLRERAIEQAPDLITIVLRGKESRYAVRVSHKGATRIELEIDSSLRAKVAKSRLDKMQVYNINQRALIDSMAPDETVDEASRRLNLKPSR